LVELTSRERVMRTLQHQEPDRVPVDVGGGLCSISQFSYRKLLKLLKWDEEVVVGGLLTQVVWPSERMLERLGSDYAHIFAGPPDVRLGKNLEGSIDDSFDSFESGTGPRHAFMDEWGVVWKRAAYYYDMVDFPLKDATSISDLDSYRWPDPVDPGRFRGLADRAKAARERQVAVTLDPLAGGIIEMANSMRGLQNFFLDMAANKAFAETLLDGITDFFEEFYEQALKAAGEHIDIVFFGDDYGMQNNMIISPRMWRKMIKPRLARLIAKIKNTSDVYFQLHSCGAITPILDDLVEIGVDIINPLQPTAAGMDLPAIKKRYGDQLVFHGVIDQQETLPNGQPEDVRNEVKARIRDLAPAGGYVVAVSPNIQADVSPENILALFDAVRELGVYPISDIE
jgi:uroporphyrinogen decarboxylase